MADGPRHVLARLVERGRADPTLAAVVCVTLAALLLRFAFLGERVAHWDEARVAYWTLRYLETGDLHYRYIIHGPFVRIVTAPVFALFGANDVTARAVVALVGGFLPLSALLLRAHLRDGELVALALLLAASPILLYYSRFYRSSLLVAAFMFTAFGLFVRAVDTWRPQYLHAGVVLAALGFAAKENAVVYLLVWLGAAALLADHALYRPTASTTGVDRLGAAWRRLAAEPDDWRPRARRALGHAVLAGGLFVLVAAFFYAPRSGDPGGVGLWQALRHPGRVPALVDLTVGHVVEGYGYWFGGATEPGCHQSNLVDSYRCFLSRSLRVLAGFATVVMTFGVVGFLAERYGVERPRNLVMFASYWGFASLLGYPLGADVFGAWMLANVVVPLSIPAAVGLGLVYRWGREAMREGDRASAGLVALVLLVAAGQVAVTGASGVYLQPQSPTNGLVQYAQPAGDLRPELRRMHALSRETAGPDVLLYGDWLVDGQTAAVRTPACADWFNALPLPWYFAANDVTVTCATNGTELERLDAMPPVVIARANRSSGLAARLEGYEVTTVEFRAAERPPPPRVTVFVRTAPGG